MRKSKKQLIAMGMVMAMCMAGGCGKSDSANTNGSADATTQQTASVTDSSSNLPMSGVTNAEYIDGFDQTAKPEKGETIATLSVKDYGDIVVRFFDEIAPYGVENFLTHAKAGYYDGLKFHRVINDFMIQGGDPQGNGTGGESIWGESFYNELSEQACVIRGSLCYANTGNDPSNGSQFFITQKETVTEEEMEGFESQGLKFTDEQKKSYLENGGCPWLQGGYTVFGQVIEGMDIVDKIAGTTTDDSDMPAEDVIISSVTVSEYEGE